MPSTLLPKMPLPATMIGTRHESSGVGGSRVEQDLAGGGVDDRRYCARRRGPRRRRSSPSPSFDDGPLKLRRTRAVGRTPPSSSAAVAGDGDRVGVGAGLRIESAVRRRPHSTTGWESASGRRTAQPASRRADSAAADRAASGRMRTENLESQGKGSLHPPASFLRPALRNRHADTGMESGVPSTGDFRRSYPAPMHNAGESPEAPEVRRRRLAGWASPTPWAAASSPRSPASSTARASRARRTCPRSGPVIFASNHLSFLDSIAIPVAAPRPVHFLAKASYFEGTGFSGWLSRVLHRDRRRPRAARRRAGGARRARPAARAARSRAAPSRSIPRARARSTAASTRAAPASPSSRCRPARRSCRSGSSAPTR